jgi:pyrroline-5-carboxylate reductase
MPNTATHVQKSITAICTQNHQEEELNRVKRMFETLGGVLHVDEELIAAVTVLGACGIAYVMRFIRAMVQGGIQIGFSAEMASTIVKHTVNGASELLLQGDTHPETEIDKVTTPKGCTIVGLNEMEHNGFSSALIRGIVKSFEALDK